MERKEPLFKLRLPEGLREKLEQEAKASSRSLTAEILHRLEMSFSDINTRLSNLEKIVYDGKIGNENLFDCILDNIRDLEDHTLSYEHIEIPWDND